ncbi:hypothetical protein D3C81_1480880 [compost metagenome]
MQDTAAAVLEVAGVEGQVAVGCFKHTATVIQQAANFEFGLAAAPQSAQLPLLVGQAGRAHAQGAVAFDNALLVVQRTAEVELDQVAGDLTTSVAAVDEVMTTHLHCTLAVKAAIAVVEGSGSNVHIAGLCSDSPAIVADAGTDQLQALGLENAALTVVQVEAVAQYAQGTRLQGAIEAGQGASTVVDAAGLERGITGLGKDFATLVV